VVAFRREPAGGQPRSDLRRTGTAAAQAELAKLHFLGADSSLTTGSDGAVELTVENAAEYR